MKKSNKLSEIKVGHVSKVILITVLPLVIAFIINLILSEVQKFFGTRTLIIVVVFLGVTLLIIVFIWYKLLKETSKKLVLPILKETLSEQISSGRPLLSAGSIICETDLAEFERTYPFCENAEIWIISNDLAPDLCGGQYVDIVPANLQRGIKYKPESV